MGLIVDQKIKDYVAKYSSVAGAEIVLDSSKINNQVKVTLYNNYGIPYITGHIGIRAIEASIPESDKRLISIADKEISFDDDYWIKEFIFLSNHLVDWINNNNNCAGFIDVAPNPAVLKGCLLALKESNDARNNNKIVY